MELKKLTLQDKGLFQRFLADKHCLSTYHFANIFIWKALFKISWVILKEKLCIFFQDRWGCFMYLPPLGKEQVEPSVLETCFKLMDRYNVKNPHISRIENVEEKELAHFKKLGYTYYSKPGDYLYCRDALVNLKGNPYKSQRWGYNYFIRNYQYTYQPFIPQDKSSALRLYRRWQEARKEKFKEPLYQKMLADNFTVQKVAAENFKTLDLIGYTLRIKNRLCAYSFGFKLNHQTFCVLAETCDLSCKGISNFIFREFCRRLNNIKYINTLDDSGLENLKKVKLAYHPLKIISNYVIIRNTPSTS